MIFECQISCMQRLKRTRDTAGRNWDSAATTWFQSATADSLWPPKPSDI